MTQIATAYADFWGQFINLQTGRTIPAFPDVGAVVQVGNRFEPPPFPYITYPLDIPALMENRVGNFASIWDQRPTMPGFLGLVNDVLQQMKEAMPALGSADLRLDDRSLVSLYFRGTRIMGDPDNRATTRGLLLFDVRSRTTL